MNPLIYRKHRICPLYIGRYATQGLKGSSAADSGIACLGLAQASPQQEYQQSGPSALPRRKNTAERPYKPPFW